MRIEGTLGPPLAQGAPSPKQGSGKGGASGNKNGFAIVLNFRVVRMYFKIPANGTPLIAAPGTTNPVVAVIEYGNGKKSNTGTVTWGVTPSYAGTILSSPTDVRLGETETAFVRNPIPGFAPGAKITATAKGLTNEAGEPLPDVSASLPLGQIAFEKLWEADNEANLIFNPTPKDDPGDFISESDSTGVYGVERSRLYMVARNAVGTCSMKLKLKVSPEIRSQVRVAVFEENGEKKVAGTDTTLPLDESQPIAFNFTPTLANKGYYVFKAGVDTSGNGHLENQEAQSLYVYTPPQGVQRVASLCLITKERYEGAYNFLSLQRPIPYLWYSPNARKFLDVFLFGQIPEGWNDGDKPRSEDYALNAFAVATRDVSNFSEWLTHNTGAQFNENGVANIKKYIWISERPFARFLTQRTPFALRNNQGLTKTGESLKTFYELHVQPLVKSWFDAHPDKNTMATEWFSRSNSQADWDNSQLLATKSVASWVPLTTVETGSDRDSEDKDAAAMVGRGRLQGAEYRFVVDRVNGPNGMSYNVAEVDFRGVLSDLYDFNIECKSPADSAAIVQLAYRTGVYYGAIYTWAIEMSATYANPFN